MKSICVFCGSSLGKRPLYAESAKQLGRVLAQKGLTLVYGGSKTGLMGVLADAALAGGGKVVGVLPDPLRTLEVAHSGLAELHIVKNMHERKAKMAELSDAFIALPGGFGTLDEVMEVVTWNQLRLHAKPVGFLNVDGYYDTLFSFLEKSVEEEFVYGPVIETLVMEADPAKLVERLLKEPWPDLGAWPKIPCP